MFSLGVLKAFMEELKNPEFSRGRGGNGGRAWQTGKNQAKSENRGKSLKISENLRNSKKINEHVVKSNEQICKNILRKFSNGFGMGGGKQC